MRALQHVAAAIAHQVMSRLAEHAQGLVVGLEHAHVLIHEHVGASN